MLPFLQAMTWLDVVVALVDIFLVSYLVYRLFLLIRGTRAIPLLNGVALLVDGGMRAGMRTATPSD